MEAEGFIQVPDIPSVEIDEGDDIGNLLGPASAPSVPGPEAAAILQPAQLSDGMVVVASRIEPLMHLFDREEQFPHMKATLERGFPSGLSGASKIKD